MSEEIKLKEMYSKMWKRSRGNLNFRSATNILQIFFQWYKPKSIIDMGCGVGSWIGAARDLGIEDVKGIDIVEIDENLLLVPKTYIEVANLETYKPSNNKKYDLTISIEVAEHLTEGVAEDFINTLTSLSDIVLFSAANPLQRGTGHINCREPQYWCNIFSSKGYVCFDILRDIIRDFTNDEVNVCHKQNVLIYVKKDKKEIFEKLGFKTTEKPYFFYYPEYVNAAVKEASNRSNKLLNSIAWWIPVRKWRQKFRAKFQ